MSRLRRLRPLQGQTVTLLCQQGSPLVLRIPWGAGYPFLATAHNLESVHTRLFQPRVHQLPQALED